jgi:hypothetical protein
MKGDLYPKRTGFVSQSAMKGSYKDDDDLSRWEQVTSKQSMMVRNRSMLNFKESVY